MKRGSVCATMLEREGVCVCVCVRERVCECEWGAHDRRQGKEVTFSLAKAGFARAPPWLLAVKLQCCRAAVHSARLTVSLFETGTPANSGGASGHRVQSSMADSALAAAAADPVTPIILAVAATMLSLPGTAGMGESKVDGVVVSICCIGHNNGCSVGCRISDGRRRHHQPRWQRRRGC